MGLASSVASMGANSGGLTAKARRHPAVRHPTGRRAHHLDADAYRV